jgi:hypothetical protein
MYHSSRDLLQGVSGAAKVMALQYRAAAPAIDIVGTIPFTVAVPGALWCYAAGSARPLRRF